MACKGVFLQSFMSTLLQGGDPRPTPASLCSRIRRSQDHSATQLDLAYTHSCS